LRSSPPPTGTGISGEFAVAPRRPAVALDAAAGVRGIPVQLTTLVGREREIATVRHLLSRTRLLTLTGNVVVTSKSGQVQSTRLVVDLRTKKSTFSAGGGTKSAPHGL